MKRFLFSLALMALLPAMAFAEHVEPTRAQKVAKTFLSNNDVRSAQLTDVASAAGFTNLYIFNAHPGFVVMAADDRVQPILGYSLTGTFVTDNMPDNVRGWLQGYDDEIQAAIDHRMSASSETTRKWHDLENGVRAPRAVIVVNPLIQTKWNQTSPYNMYCPTIGNTTTVTGCVATAMAQVMKYWNWPDTGVGSHEYTWHEQTLSADFAATTYKWSNMTDTYGSSSTLEQKEAVATLMYHCGVSVEMDYGLSSTGGSGAYGGYVPDALKDYFRYAPSATYKSKESFSDDQWKALIKFELNESRPVFYCGSYVTSTGTGGHAFVCDGYRSDDYFHFNWGWGGNNDGYFAIGALNPGGGNTGSGSGTYNLGNCIMVYAEPLSDLAAPVLSAVSQDDNIVLTWESVEGASSYDVYKDNVIVATDVTDLQYIDQQLPFGVYYDYYVRAVSGQVRSNMSNVVSICSNYRVITPSNLTVNYDAGSATLNWIGYTGQFTTDLHYGVEADGAGYGFQSGTGVYWGQRFPNVLLTTYEGMQINQVSFYANAAVEYKLYVFEILPSNNNNKLCEQTYTASTTGWNDIELSQPISIDVSKDLWVILYSDGYSYPASFGAYSGDGVNDAQYISAELSNIHQSIIGSDISWAIRTYLTDGTYTYNLYRNDEAIASNLSTTTYSDNDIPLGTNTYYVKTNYGAGESAASNTVNLTIAEQPLLFNTGWNWWAPQVEMEVSDLQNALGSNATIIMYNVTTTGHIVGGEMFKIHLPAASGSSSLIGILADLSLVEVPIGEGVNWFGYPGTTSISLTDLVITPALGDKIISQNDGFAIYGPDGWSGTLTALQPQHGYVYVSEAQEAKTLKFYTEMP